jgi:hypothetical protein
MGYVVRQCHQMECFAVPKLSFPELKFGLEGFDMTTVDKQTDFLL